MNHSLFPWRHECRSVTDCFLAFKISFFYVYKVIHCDNKWNSSIPILFLFPWNFYALWLLRCINHSLGFPSFFILTSKVIHSDSMGQSFIGRKIQCFPHVVSCYVFFRSWVVAIISGHERLSEIYNQSGWNVRLLSVWCLGLVQSPPTNPSGYYDYVKAQIERQDKP